ncbi:MAG: hypothetical protein NUV46_03440 [Nanoarchaeota archaeon]|nr:hypothetical protein [Nanoarchaeota archaeon]
MNGKKGLSTVVTTLIIVLLVLAAIGIIWGPIRGLLSSSTDSLSQTACFEIDLKATKVVLDVSGYNVTLRKQGGSDSFDVGAMLIFYSNITTSEVVDSGLIFNQPTQVLTAGPFVGVPNAIKVEVIPYLIDKDTGEEKVCSTSTETSINN